MSVNPAAEYTTAQLIDFLRGVADLPSGVTVENIGQELYFRTVPDDYADSTMRGGTRPTHQPPNP